MTLKAQNGESLIEFARRMWAASLVYGVDITGVHAGQQYELRPGQDERHVIAQWRA